MIYTYAHKQLDDNNVTMVMDLIDEGEITSEGDIKYLAHAMRLSYTNLQLLIEHLQVKRLDDSINALVTSHNSQSIGV